jgi:hypothetical protein
VPSEDADVKAITSQLERPPRGNWRVARRCGCGLPQVIETDPRLDDGTPFPTLWWLTCRRLVSAVSRLEGESWMRKINERLGSDEKLRRELQHSTDRYLQTRDAIEPLGLGGHPGGGPGRLKCLHAHTAHHLVAGDNPVGRLVLEQLAWADPSEPCV